MRKTVALLVAGACVFIWRATPTAQPPQAPKVLDDDGMSPMGHLAAAQARARAKVFLIANGLAAAESGPSEEPCDDNGCDPGSEEDGSAGPESTQSEVAIAIHPAGMHLVVAFNDFRGFSNSPVSVSGYAYSDDGGATWTDGHQLPVTSNGTVSGTSVPQVLGDPDVKYVPGGLGCQFVYTSIMVKGLGPGPAFTGSAQTMSLHRSTDCGHTWTGPFEIPPATNPHGALLTSGNAVDSADKELIDVDPVTGRVLMSWSNFTVSTFFAGGVEIRTTFSDNVMTATPPTWSPGVVVNSPASAALFETGSIPRFAGASGPNVYVAWATVSRTTGLSNTRVSTSTNRGASWLPPVTLNASDIFPIDYILGNDRVHSFPGLAVGPEGNVYVVYANNDNHDGADIAFHRSTNGGVSFSAATMINARPGLDRAQWFPYAATDANGRLYVTYYDQGVATSGDLMDARYMFSDNGGVTWSTPSPLMSTGCVGVNTDPRDCRPFHGGYGNDTSQPNLGDYIGATTAGGKLYAVWAATPRQVSFVDGQATAFPQSFTTPDFYVNKIDTAKAALALGTPAFTETGGNGLVDAGDQVALTLPLSSYVTNASDSPVTYTSVSGTLSTSTPGVSILTATRSYPAIAPGASASNASAYAYAVSPAFVPGTKIELSLVVTTAQGSTTLLFTQNTGTPVATTIFSENFNGVSAGTLPAGWTTIHAGGANTVPWTTSSSFCGTTSNGLFHINANDGVGGTGNPSRFERAASPSITIPGNAQYVTLDFDVCYDTEDDPNFNVLAYDGGLLRITDFTNGHFARANLVEAFAESITTGSLFHYPKHGPRSSNTAYFQDMSMWSGDSRGFKHVSMRLPGMEGTVVQLRPDFTQDSIGTCTDVRASHTSCGIIIDNIVMRSVVTKSDELLEISLVPVVGAPGQYSGTVRSQAIAPAGGILVALSAVMSAGSISLPASTTIPAGSTASPSFLVTVSPASPGSTGTVTATGPSNVRVAGISGVPSAWAMFVRHDAATQGNWKGVYGAEGFSTANDTTRYPSYATVSMSGFAPWTWSGSTAEARALRLAASATARQAATWYAPSSFTIDVNLTDNATHQIALYLLDWDMLSRAETVDVLDVTSGAVIDTRAAGGFSGGDYLLWQVRGHVVFRVTRTAGANGVVGGIFFDPTSVTHAPPAVTLTQPAPGPPFTAPATINFAASATAYDGATITEVAYYAGPSQVAVGSSGPTFPAQLISVPPGTYVLTARATDSLGSTTTSAPVTVTVATSGPPGGTTATLVQIDATTQGNWPGTYGSDGYLVANDGVNLPLFAQVTLSGQSTWTWGMPAADVRALVVPGNPTQRIASTFYSSTSFSIDVNLTDGATHQVALYVLDFDNLGRTETIDVLDAISLSRLDGAGVLGFKPAAGGVYVVFLVSGHVKFQITRVDAKGTTAAANAVVSGVFFDSPLAEPVPASASFVRADTTTQGSWPGVYGGDGYDVVNNAISYPAYAQVGMAGQSTWTWNGTTTTDIRALRKAVGAAGERIAATAYASNTFAIDVNLRDGAAHQIALYAVDWDNLGRIETIDVLDAVSGATLVTRTVSAFTGGQYLVWRVAGHVVFRVTRVAGPNAVVSGIFFDVPTPAISGVDDLSTGGTN